VPRHDKHTVGAVIPSKRVANVSSGIPIILFSSATVRQWIREDVELAWRYAIDALVVDQIAAAAPGGPTGSPVNVFKEVLYARAEVAAAGYAPDVVVVSPADALAIELLQLTGGDSYAFSQQLTELVVSPSISDGAAFVADSSSAGTLYSSPTRFEVFVDDPKKNTYIARYESNANFQVHRTDAICMLAGTP
jgi:hypothetical protein